MIKEIKVKGIDWENSSIVSTGLEVSVDIIPFDTHPKHFLDFYVSQELKKHEPHGFKGFDYYDEVKDTNSYFMIIQGHKVILAHSEAQFLKYIERIRKSKHPSMNRISTFIEAYVYFRDYMPDNYLFRFDFENKKVETCIKKHDRNCFFLEQAFYLTEAELLSYFYMVTHEKCFIQDMSGDIAKLFFIKRAISLYYELSEIDFAKENRDIDNTLEALQIEYNKESLMTINPDNGKISRFFSGVKNNKDIFAWYYPSESKIRVYCRDGSRDAIYYGPLFEAEKKITTQFYNKLSVANFEYNINDAIYSTLFSLEKKLRQEFGLIFKSSLSKKPFENERFILDITAVQSEDIKNLKNFLFDNLDLKFNEMIKFIETLESFLGKFVLKELHLIYTINEGEEDEKRD